VTCTEAAPRTAAANRDQGTEQVWVTALRRHQVPQYWDLVAQSLECLRARGIPVDARALARAPSDRATTVYLVRRGQNPIGYMVTRRGTQGLGCGALWVEIIFALPRCGGREVRQALLAAVEAEARVLGVSRICCETPRPGLGRLLMQNGFRPAAISFVREVRDGTEPA